LKDKKINILFRTDSSSTIGLGHVMRCLVLAQRLKLENKNTNIIFATQKLDGDINSKIIDNGFKVHTLSSTKKNQLIKLLSLKNIDLLIIDSYEIGPKYEKEIIKKIKCKTLVFDDMFKRHNADIVLNHGLHVEKKSYKNLVSKNTKVFCGSKYTILRDEFFQQYKNSKDDNKIAIILGGNDIQNLSLKIAKLLKSINPKYKITVITTSVNKNISQLKKEKDITLLVGIKNIAKILSKHSLIICASGGNLFEVMALKKHFINIQIADNQDSIVKFLKKKKIFTTLDKEDINSLNLKKQIEYTSTNNVYDKLDYKFSKTTLARKILSELT